jgi:hypothetical protein
LIVVQREGRALNFIVKHGLFIEKEKSMLAKTLKWPFVGVLLAGTVHFTAEAIWPELQPFYPAPVLALVQFAFGVGAGYMAIQNGGNFFSAVLCGALLGLFPLVVNPLSFGLMLGRPIPATILAGIFGFTMFFWGSLVGGAFAASMKESRR